MNFKNNRPKSWKGHCAMCAEGRPRNRRALTRQELAAGHKKVEVVEAVALLQEAELALVDDYCFCESCCGVSPDPCRETGPEIVELIATPPLRAPVLLRAA